jgi:arsenate reductase-like glutaredoxin family protein
MNEHHKIEEKIEQSEISNECIILFERELSASELEMMKVKSGSRIFEQPMNSPPFLLRILEECYGWEIPDDATFYRAFDYHSVLFLLLCDPAPLLIYRNEKETENFFTKTIEFQDACNELLFSLNEPFDQIKDQYKQLNSLRKKPAEAELDALLDDMRSAILSDFETSASDCIDYISSITVHMDKNFCDS